MLDVALARLDEMFPNSCIMVVTSRPHMVQKFWPSVKSVQGRKKPSYIERIVKRGLPPKAKHWVHNWKGPAANQLNKDLEDEIDAANAVVLSGGGYLTDIFPEKLEATLRLIDRATQLEKPIALFGQGIGPFECKTSRDRLRQALSNACVLGLREGIYSPIECNECGNLPGLYQVTGDDALVLGQWFGKNAPAGDRVGINVRTTAYAGLGPQEFAELKHAVEKIDSVARSWSGVEIRVSHAQPDRQAIEQIGLSATRVSFLTGNYQLLDILNHIASCRVVIAGSYHAAVFALSIGTPVVAFFASQYYQRKFEGLRGQFPEGIEVVNLRRSDAGSMLVDGFEKLWSQADELRNRIGERRDSQVECSAKLYRSLREKMEAVRWQRADL